MALPCYACILGILPESLQNQIPVNSSDRFRVLDLQTDFQEK